VRKIKFVPLRRNRWNFISNLISNDAFDSRDCNLILITWLDEVTVPLTPEIEIFSGRVSKPRASINFLDTKFACDPQSYKARHVLREPSPSQTSTTAVEGMTYSLLNDPEAWIARTEGGGVALDATSLSVLLVDGSAAEGVWSSIVPCLAPYIDRRCIYLMHKTRSASNWRKVCDCEFPQPFVILEVPQRFCNNKWRDILDRSGIYI